MNIFNIFYKDKLVVVNVEPAELLMWEGDGHCIMKLRSLVKGFRQPADPELMTSQHLAFILRQLGIPYFIEGNLEHSFCT